MRVPDCEDGMRTDDELREEQYWDDWGEKWMGEYTEQDEREFRLSLEEDERVGDDNKTEAEA